MYKTILTIMYISLSISSYAQHQKKGQWLLGGDFGFTTGNNSSYFGIAPEISFLYNNGVEIGGSIGYSRITTNNISRNIYSIGPVVSYNINQTFFARSRYQYLKGTISGTSNNSSFNESSLWLGGGYINRFQNGGMIRFGAMFNVLYNEDSSIYNSPILPFASYSFGF